MHVGVERCGATARRARLATENLKRWVVNARRKGKDEVAATPTWTAKAGAVFCMAAATMSGAEMMWREGCLAAHVHASTYM